jgi:hypothetical protein
MRYAQTTSALLFVALISAVPVGAASSASLPRPVSVARATEIPACALFVDSAAKGGNGSAANPHATIAAAVEAATPGAIICVAEGTYAEQIAPGDKHFTLAGGFQRGFKVRDSAKFMSKAKGNGEGSFLRIADTGPKDGLTAIDGFEITGYSQAIVRDYYEPQRFDITNNNIHDNTCTDPSFVGAGFALNNVSGTISGNVIRKNSCGRGGAGFLNDTTNQNTVKVVSNLVDGNSGTEAGSAHGGGLYLFGNKLEITGNAIINNSVTKWGGGLYIGAYVPGNQPTTATLAGNSYYGNTAGDSGGGFFCDEGATCVSSYEVYDSNCGGNVLVDGGAEGAGPTRAKFDHITNVRALEPGCAAPGTGIFVDTWDGFAADTYSVMNSVFWGNAPEKDIQTSCGKGCSAIKVSVANSLLQKKYAKEGGIVIAFGAGIIDSVDPQFTAPEKGDYSLRPGSPAAGKGSDKKDLGAGGVGSEAQPAPVKSGGGASVQTPTAAAPVETAQGPTAPPAETPPPAKSAAAGADDISAKEAFEAARQLGTVKAWNAFLARYPSGFYTDLAQAYIDKLGGSPAQASAAASQSSSPVPIAAGTPAIARGAQYMGFPEKFNRYYTDPAWKPSTNLYVSADGNGDGATPQTPGPVKDAMAKAKPGTQINFAPGKYQGCFELAKEGRGTYEDPVVLFGGGAASISCCTGGRKTCINLEQADYVAVDGFELIGGSYGVRAVGADFAASQHSRGIAVLNTIGHDQERDPFFTGQSDWAVIERTVGYGAKKGDGHGIYISNGSDWNIVRFNETYSNLSSDFQINADPTSTCKEVGIPFDDTRCDAYAGEGEGGQGASDYFLVDSNYFHHGSASGPNFTSVRRSVIRNNVFGPQVRHNVSFWQETDNPKLGSSDNKILHNLFITTGKHGVQFSVNSTRNEFANNVLVGAQISGGKVTANPKALLMETDGTVGDNVYRANLYVSGMLEGREPNGDETAREDFSPAWFAKFPAALNHALADFKPAADAPFLGAGALLPDAPSDAIGTPRSGAVDLGPIELP